MSDLSNFCNAVLEALSVEGQRPRWFNSALGLCYNSRSFDLEFCTCARPELDDVLEGKDYPFNNDSSSSFDDEYFAGTIYQNKKRLAFLKKQARKV